MKKIEMVWRELLFQTIEKKNNIFTQKELAKRFGFSTSTVFQALKSPRKMGAVRVSGRNFILEDPDKLLYHWASVRNLDSDIILSGRINLPPAEIEGRMPPDVVFGGFTAAKEILEGRIPADYDKVYVYASKTEQIGERIKVGKGIANLFVLKADDLLESYGQITTLAQTFVDLWNLSEWYAKEFTKALKEKFDESLLA